jgi:hypothetical protein
MHAEMHFGNVRYHCQILAEIEICSHILVELSNIKFYENPLRCSQFVTYRHGEANMGIFTSFYCTKRNKYYGACSIFF